MFLGVFGRFWAFFGCFLQKNAFLTLKMSSTRSETKTTRKGRSMRVTYSKLGANGLELANSEVLDFPEIPQNGLDRPGSA